MINIRPALPSDMDDIVRMGASFHAAAEMPVPFDERSFRMTAIAALLSDSMVAIVAEHDEGGPCGIILGVMSHHWWNDEVLVMNEMMWWVDPEHRGVGRRLKAAFEAEAIRLGATAIGMASTTRLDADRLERIYRREGFVPVDINYLKVMPCQVQS